MLCDTEDIGEDTGGGDGSASAGTLDDHGVLLVTFGGEGDERLGATEASGGMVVGDADGTDTGFKGFVGGVGRDEDGEITEGFVVGFEGVDVLLESAVVLFECGEEVVEIAFGEDLFGDEGFDGDVFEFDGEAEFADQDQGFSGDIEAGEVILGLRFGIAEFTGSSDGLREWSSRHDFVAEVAEGSREGAFDAQDAIACTDERLEGVDHG